MSNWFPTPNITNYTGLIDYANDVTGNVFGASIPWMIFIVSFITLSGYGYKTEQCMLVSSYTAWVLSILMRVLGWIPDAIVVLFAVMTGVSIFLSYKGGSK